MSPIILLSGAGGGTLDPAVFWEASGDVTRYETIGYPGWRRYIEDSFSAKMLVVDLAAQIASRVPRRPIRIVGVSIGGHFGYAAALHLQSLGREIAGFCAIDTFMVASAAPSSGWVGRVVALGLALLRDRRVGEFTRLLRSRFWRALFRLAGNRLPDLLNRFLPSGRLPWILAFDPMFEEELSMRLLIRGVAPWIASLDRDPVALKAPAILLRTRDTARDDAAWRRRCPGIKIIEMPGDHQTLFEQKNLASLRESFIAATRDWQ